MATTKKNILFNRARFDQGASYYGSKGIVPQTAQIRCAVPLTNSSTGVLKFDIKKDASLAFAIEQLLKRTDLFVASSIGFALMIEDSGFIGQAPLMSYPVIQSGALPTGIKGFIDPSAYALYNGILTMRTGNTVNYSRFPMIHFLNVPETQPVSLLNGADAAVSAQIQPKFNLEDVMFELPEVLIFAGTKDQPITVEFPAANIVPENNSTNTAYGVLIIDGWLYETATAEQYKESANPYELNI
jgi:hypothetical protein